MISFSGLVLINYELWEPVAGCNWTFFLFSLWWGVLRDQGSRIYREDGSPLTQCSLILLQRPWVAYCVFKTGLRRKSDETSFLVVFIFSVHLSSYQAVFRPVGCLIFMALFASIFWSLWYFVEAQPGMIFFFTIHLLKLFRIY